MRSFFLTVTSCGEKDILRPQDIVSLKYDFYYYWSAALRQQRALVLKPVFAVQGSEAIVCPEFIAKDVTCCTICACCRGDRLPKKKQYKHVHVNAQRHVCAETLMHNRKHARCCADTNCRFSKMLMSPHDLIYDNSIPRYLR